MKCEVREVIKQLETAVNNIENEISKVDVIHCSFCEYPIKNVGRFKSLCPICDSYT